MTYRNVDTAKSYATEANLIAALEKSGLAQCNPIIVRNREGRWTAIFGAGLSGHYNPFSIAHLGFHVVN